MSGGFDSSTGGDCTMRPKNFGYRLVALAAAIALLAAACGDGSKDEAAAASAAASDALAEAQAARSEASAANTGASAADASAAAADAAASAAGARAEEAIAAAELALATAEGNEDAVAAAEAALAQAQEAAASAQAEAASAQAEAAAAQAEAAQARAAAEQAAAEAEAAAAPPPPAPEPPPPPPEPVTFTMIFPAVPSNVDPAVYQGRPTGETTQSVVSTLVRYVAAGRRRDRAAGTRRPRGRTRRVVDPGGQRQLRVHPPRGTQPVRQLTRPPTDVLWTFQRGLATDFITPFLLSVGGIDRENPIEVIDGQHIPARGPVRQLTHAARTHVVRHGHPRQRGGEEHTPPTRIPGRPSGWRPTRPATAPTRSNPWFRARRSGSP